VRKQTRWVKHQERTLHTGELLGRIHVEGSRVDRLTMPNRRPGNDLSKPTRDGKSIKYAPHNLKQGKFEAVASFHSHTEIGEYEKGSIFPAIL